MSTFKHPVGPQPSRVYWRRRLVLLLALLAVVLVIVLIVVRPGSSSGETPKPVSTSASASTTKPTAAATSIPTTSATASGKQCDPSNITVGAVTDASSYGAGQLPQLSVSITNTGASACTLDAGTSQQVFTITSGSETYWKSTDCQTQKVDATVLLQPGKTISSQTPITWDRTRSDPATCQAKREQVPAGGASYHLATSVAGIASAESKQFILK